MPILPFRSAVSLAFVTLLATPAAAQVKWDLPTPYADGNFHTRNIKQFAEEAKAGSGGKLEIAVHGGASLYKLPEIKRAVQTGQVQIGETLMAALSNEDAMYEADTVPFLARGFDEAKRLYDATRTHIENRLQRQGLVLLFSVPWPTQGIYTKAPLAGLADIKGSKMRTYNSTTSRFAELLGAVPTTVQAAEVSQAFATGMVQSMITSAATGVDTSAWEYVSHYSDVRLMHSKNMVIANQRALAALDAPVRTALLEAARRAEERGWSLAREVETETTARIAERGIKVTVPQPALAGEFERVGGILAGEWAQRAGADGQAVLKQLR